MSIAQARWLVISGALLLATAPAAARVELQARPDGTVLMSNLRSVKRLSPAPSEPALALRRAIEQESRRWRLDPELVTAVIAAESGFDPAAVSHKGAVGLMQLMPATSRQLAVENPLDPLENVAGGVRYLRELLDRFDGRLELALAGYNAGPGAVMRHRGIPPYRETRSYVAKVLHLYRGRDFPLDAVGLAPVGRRTFLRRDPRGRLVLTTSPD